MGEIFIKRRISISLVLLFLCTFIIPINLISEEHKPTKAYQLHRKFPEEKPTSRYYARYRDKFKSYSGTGSLIINNFGATSAEIYINGEKLNINLPKDDKSLEIDLSAYTLHGENTIKVLNLKPEGAYITTKIPYPTLLHSTASKEGFSERKLKMVDNLINNDIKMGFPGAQLTVIKNGKIIKNTTYGYSKLYDENGILSNPEPMTNDILFDLASNTKMMATNLAIKKLVYEGKLDINEYVCRYLPDFEKEGREKITIKHLLEHTSGLDSSIKFYQEDTGAGPEFYSQNRSKTLELLNKVPLVYETGTKYLYSDTGFMILGYVVEMITDMQLDEYVEKNIYEPLGLDHTLFTPLSKGFDVEDCAATETQGNTRGNTRTFPEIRKTTVQGEVHDEKAFYSLYGVAGHAGLFSTAEDLAVLCQLMLNKGGYGEYRLCDENTIDTFMNRSSINPNMAIGWNRAADGDRLWMFSPYASSDAIGHTGWTGTLTIIDPKYDLAIILLTNKKNTPCVDGKFIGDTFETGLYGSVVTLIYEAFLENRNNSIEAPLNNIREEIEKLKPAA